MEIINILMIFGTVVGIPVLRSVAGWLTNALEDNEITKFETKLLYSTIIRVGFISIVTYLGLNEMGMSISLLGASGMACLTDKVIDKKR